VRNLVVYTRRGCHLCDLLLEELLPAVRGRLEVELRDVDTREDWRVNYDDRVPVVEYDGELICQYHLDRDALKRILRDIPA
jgi:Glutaredoxin-like domain (DUF836)